ncbi:efflux RND transporter permease subunit [Salinibacter ruber]|uniref:Multidrug efflux pump subunit AcrB n=1 Tax=Salinibacter ruber TaxID=146919 RepID=A0A9X2U8U7_9BACT|nr:efflux RND transporter permease subunit [Salinibacter ruber]MCS3657493.1 multidrug efflux pump subunit AcrB [Salinibacter ruber]MCS3951807.1 multidrug efflux pump subunit AcrB [Salinibacter ruber]MCS4118181.1 multidrug efflux pump subunit AcrB [Salinibacter ruber]MCS4154455.1 multidrug efflux pump subunit AcrB [Salinibacter ruber]MCS4171029.1 multidrug efflux pump subunit AcrB [Salinibacter ruber]
MKITKLALDNAPFTAIVLLLVTLLGAVSFWTMPRSEDPQFETATVRVAAVYPGASPQDIESLVVDLIEDEADELEDVDQIESTIQNGVAVTTVEFQSTVSADDAEEEVQRAVSQVESDLPGGVRDLSVEAFRTTDVSIYQAALVSETASYPTLQEAAERLAARLERTGGVKEAETWAHPEQEVRVNLNLERLRETELSLGQFAQRLEADAQNAPGGDLNVGRRQFNVQTTGDYESLEEIRSTVVGQSGSGLVHLADVAGVKKTTEEVIHRARVNGTRAVFVTATQRAGANIFTVTERIKHSLDAVKSELPGDIALREVFDQSESVADRVHGFLWNLLQGLLLIGGVVLLALGWRTSGIVLTAIPLSILITIYGLDVTGFGLQQISIVGLIIALGLLVDDAIVVVERVARFREQGASVREAILKSMDEVGGALASTSATSILAFLPIVLMQSGSGDFIRSLPVTVIYALAASLLVTLTITPLLAAYGLGSRDGEDASEPDTPTSTTGDSDQTTGHLGWVLPAMADGAYQRALQWALRRRWIVIGGAALALAGSLALFPLIGVSFFPQAEKPQFLVNVTTPEGSSRAATDRAVRRVEEWLDGRDDVRRYAANVGRDNPMVYYNVTPRRQRATVGQVYVEATSADRVPTIASELETDLGDVPGVEYDTEIFKNGPPVEAPVAIKMIGPELPMLRDLAADVEATLEQTPGTKNVDNPLAERKIDLHVDVDRRRAGMLGVPLPRVDRAVRMAVDGLPVAEYRGAGGKEHDIVVSLPGEPQPTDLARLAVTSARGAAVPLRQVAQVELEREPARIDHFNTERAVTVTADVAPGQSAVGVTQAVVERLGEKRLPPGYRTFIGGELEAQSEGFGGLLFALIGAVFGILAVLVLQFGSVRQALIILTAIPLSVIGAFPALLITGYTFSFTAFVGFTSLAGIVVNNSTLLVDYANRLRAKGHSVLDAAVEAGQTRFAPILLTAITTIGGVLPLTLSGSSLWSPLGWVLIGGLLVATLLTLLVVPVLYTLLAAEPAA